MKRWIFLGLALLLLATLATMLIVSTVMDPATGMPAELRGKVSFGPSGSIQMHGEVTAAEWKMAQDISHAKPFSPWEHWALVSGWHPTARYVFYSGQPSGPVYPYQQPESWGMPKMFGIIIETYQKLWHVLSDAAGQALGFFMMTAKADTLSTDTTTVNVVSIASTICQTTQTTSAGDDAILVMVSGPANNAISSVTFSTNVDQFGNPAAIDSVNLTNINSVNGGATTRAEMWAYQGRIPGNGGSVTTTTVTASASQKMVCSTVLVKGVTYLTAFTTGSVTTSNTTANATITISPAAGEFAYGVLAITGTTSPTAVTGTGAAAVNLYGGTTATAQCTSATNAVCGAGVSMPNPGTLITWTNGAVQWATAGVRFIPGTACAVANGTCYRIAAGGLWTATANWSLTSGGASCACAPTAATNVAVFNNTPTGITTLAAATTVAALDMTGFNGTLDTVSGQNFGLTVNVASFNTYFAIGGTFLAQNSTIAVTGDVTMVGPNSTVNLGGSTWTITNGQWINYSKTQNWFAGTSTVTIKAATAKNLRFASLVGNKNEFNNLTIDSNAAAGVAVTYTALQNNCGTFVTPVSCTLFVGGTLTVTNTVASATAVITLDLNANNVPSTVGAVTLGGTNTGGGRILTGSGNTQVNGAITFSATTTVVDSIVAGSGTWTATGNFSIPTAASAGFVSFGAGLWTIAGSWTNGSTSASWVPGAVTFNSAGAQTMTFCTTCGTVEFTSPTFSPTGAATFTMATNNVRWNATMTLNNNATVATANLTLTGGSLTVNNGAVLTANASSATLVNVTMTAGTSGTITLTTAVWTVSGNWNTSGAGSTFTKGTSAITMSGPATTVAVLSAATNFNNLTISAAGTVTQNGLLDVGGILAVNAGAILATSTFQLTVATLGASMAGGISADLVSVGSAKAINSASTTLAATGFFSWGAASWTIASSTWTNASTSASWAAGTGTVLFNSATGIAAFTPINLSVNEFFNVTFTSSAAAPQSFVLATRPLRWGGTLSITDGSSTTTLDSSAAGTGILGAILSVGNAGILTDNAQAITTTDVTMTGGASGTITLTTATWTAAGTWNTSGVGSVFTKGTSVVIMTGAAKNISILNASNGFASLTVNGSYTMLTLVDVSTATVIGTAGSLNTGGFAFSGNGTLTLNDGATLTALNSAFTVSDVTATGTANVTTLTLTSGAWAVSGNWNTSGTGVSFLSGGSTITMSGAAKTLNMRPSQDNFDFNNLTISGTVTLASALTITGTLATSGSGTLTTAGFAIAGSISVNATLSLVGTGGIVGTTSVMTFASVTVGTGTTISVSTGTIAATGAVSITGTMTVSGAGFLSFGSNGVTINTGGVLNGNAATITSGAVTMTGGVSGTITLTSAVWTASGNWNTSGAGSTFTKGTSNIILSGAGTTVSTLNTSNGFATLTISGSVTMSTAIDVSVNTLISGTLTSGGLTLSGAGDFTVMDLGSAIMTTSTVTVTNVAMAQHGSLSITSGSWTVSGNWNTSGEGSTFTAGTSTVTMTGDTKEIQIRNNVNGFATLVIPTATFLGTDLAVGTALNISGTLDSGQSNYSINATGTMTISGTGSLNSRNSTVFVVGVLSISAATAYVTNTGGSWIVSNSWTNSSTSASWSFAANILFNSTGSQTMTFAAVTQEFGGNVTFNSGANTTVFTMATNPLKWGGLLTVQGSGANTTTLATSNLALTGGALSVGNSGILTANTSVITVSDVSMLGGTSGTITMTSGSITASGNWDTSGAGSTFTKGTSTVTMSGNNKGVKILNASNGFYNLTTSGSITAGNLIDISNTLTISGAFDTMGFTISGGSSLSVPNGGNFIAGPSLVTVLNVTMTGGTSGAIIITTGSWTVSGNWDTSGSGSGFTKGIGTVTMSGAGKTVKILNASNGFFNLTISGTVTMSNAIDVSSTLSLTGTGTLTTAGFAVSGGANLSIANGTTLTATTSALTFTNVTMTGGASGVFTLTSGTVAVAGNWDTSGAGSVFTKGTSTVTMSGLSKTVKTLNASNGFYNLTISGFYTQTTAIDVSNALLIPFSGSLTTAGFNISGGSTLTLSAAGILLATSSTLTFGTVTIGDGTNVFISTGTLNASGAVSVTGTLTVRGTGGTLGFAANALTINTGGTVYANSAIVTVGDVTNGAGTLLVFTTGTWTVSGNWNTAGANSAFLKGTSTVIMSGAGKTINTLDALNGFFNLTISGTITMNTLIDATGTISLTGTGTLTTGGFAVSGSANLSVGNGTTLTATTSTMVFTNVTMTGGASGTISVTSALITLDGNWDTSGAGSTFTHGTSTVTMRGFSSTVKTLNSANGFYNFSLAGVGLGITTALSSITAANMLTVNIAKQLIFTGFSISFNHLAVVGDGNLTQGSIVANYFDITNSSATALTTLSALTIWNAPNGEFKWTHSSDTVGSTMTFTIGGNTFGRAWSVTKNAVLLTSGTVNNAGNVVFTSTGTAGPDTMDVTFPGGGVAHNSLVAFTSVAEPAGVNCANGGTKNTFQSGLDNGDGGGIADNGILEPGEVDNTTIFYVCNGAPGAPGANGHQALIEVTTAVEPAGVNCTNGGTKITVKTATDADDDGYPIDGADSGVTTVVYYSCKGDTGATGPAGHQALIEVTTVGEPAGVNCANGGTKITVKTATDADDDGYPIDGADSGVATVVYYSCTGATGAAGADGFNSLVDVSTAVEPPGANCTNGGTKITVKSGLDNGDGGGVARNGSLENGEVDASTTFFSCTGVSGPPGNNGHNAIAKTTPVPVDGVNCAASSNGETKFETGVDANDNGILDPAEVQFTTYICGGLAGAAGAAGHNTLVATTVEPSGANCMNADSPANAGIKVQSGVDVNNDGILQPGEVQETSYVCNGKNGKVVLTTMTVDGINCQPNANGQTKVEAGTDINGNGILDPGEVAFTKYVCGGEPGGGNGSGPIPLIPLSIIDILLLAIAAALFIGVVAVRSETQRYRIVAAGIGISLIEIIQWFGVSAAHPLAHTYGSITLLGISLVSIIYSFVHKGRREAAHTGLFVLGIVGIVLWYIFVVGL